jgi:methylphosphotriester-DNA--protein-cysteine methyltransferase
MAGRPTKEFDMKEFADLVAIGCKEDEICWFFRDNNGKPADKNTLSRWCKRTYGLNFREYREQNALMELKIQLRKNQLELSKKSAAMAIWLGKQYLDQKENIEFEDRESLARLDAILEGMKNAKSEAN